MNDIFEYPLDTEYILRRKKSIKRELLKSENFIEKKIAILGGSTTSEIKNILEIFLLNEGIKPLFYESEYNKYYEDTLFGQELEKFVPEIIYIHTNYRNIQNFSNINNSNENLVLLIGGIQGAHKDIDKEYIKKVTKDIYGIFPKKILIEALYMIEKSLGLNIKKLSVGNEMHVYRAQRYIRKRQILSDYDSFLLSLGAEKNQNNIWQLPTFLEKKDLESSHCLNRFH